MSLLALKFCSSDFRFVERKDLNKSGSKRDPYNLSKYNTFFKLKLDTNLAEIVGGVSGVTVRLIPVPPPKPSALAFGLGHISSDLDLEYKTTILYGTPCLC